METGIGIAVTILNADNMITDNRHCGTVSRKLLVCRFGIIFLCFNELVVKIQIILLSLAFLFGLYYRLHHILIHLIGCIEIV